MGPIQKKRGNWDLKTWQSQLSHLVGSLEDPEDPSNSVVKDRKSKRLNKSGSGT